MSGYIGVNNVARKIKTMYVGVNGVARKVNKAYVGINGVARTFLTSELPPNERYESKSIGTWSSNADVVAFCNTYNHANNYSGLSLGNYVTIMDGTYNVPWMIVGFDVEYNRVASDGTTYNNGYGIMLMPTVCYLERITWLKTVSETVEPYINSNVHEKINSTTAGICTYNMRQLLGNRIVNRNVLLSSAGVAPYASAYTWTTAYFTCPSVAQLNGIIGTQHNQYDDGEANYKLPIFNFISYLAPQTSGYTYYNYWTRAIAGFYIGRQCPYVITDTTIQTHLSGIAMGGPRPLVYIR